MDGIIGEDRHASQVRSRLLHQKIQFWCFKKLQIFFLYNIYIDDWYY